MAKHAVGRKIAKITREQKHKPKGKRLTRKQIAGKAHGIVSSQR